MKLFVYEHITSGALIDQPLPESLAKEGNDMLYAILKDCHALTEVEVIILRDRRLPSISFIDNNIRHQCHIISNSEDYATLWLKCLTLAEATFIIAPETDSVLYQQQKQALAKNKIILGCQPEAISLTGNKFLCDKQLKCFAIKTAKSCLASQWKQKSFENADGYVVKPVYGAGCINTFLFDTRRQLECYLTQHDDVHLKSFVVQAYIKGVSLSLSLLIDSNDVSVLSINHQKIVQSGNMLTVTGYIINELHSHSFSLSQATKLAKQIQQAISGLWGFVGIDFILSEESAIVIDVNPRLTSTYIGLKESLSLNPFELLLTVYEKGINTLPAIKQRQQIEISYE